MALVHDQRGGHEDAGVGVESVHAAADRQRPYHFKCLECGADNVGKIEDGCQVCGTGRAGEQKGPEPAVDFTCPACRGQGKVERTCTTCGGSGTVGLGDTANPPQACLTCGGGGVVAMDCARCGGTGIDPEPQTRKAPPCGEGEKLMETTKPALTGPLPKLDDPQPGAALSVVRRYLVVEVVGSPEVAEYVAGTLLTVHESMRCRRRAVEIAASPATDRLFKESR